MSTANVRGIVVAFVALSLGASSAQARQEAFDVRQYGETLYRISKDRGAYSVSVLLSTGPDGALLVDTGEAEWAEALREEVVRIAGEMPRIVINTHGHRDHTGGNRIFGEDAIIISHARMRERLDKGYLAWDEFPAQAYPKVTFSDDLTIHFNGEDIRLIAATGGHDDNDIVAWFTGSNVAALGDLSYGMGFPTVDAKANPTAFADVVATLVEILPTDVRIVSGHGRDITGAELARFQAMLAETTRLVRDAVAAGMSDDEMVAADLLHGWAEFGEGYTDAATWIEVLAAGVRNPDAISLEPAVGDLHDLFLAQGAAATVAEYRRRRAEEPSSFGFDEADVVFMGIKAAERGRTDDAETFYREALDIYPDSPFNPRAYLGLAEISHGRGDDAEAIRYLETALSINPEMPRARALLKELRGTGGA